MKQHVRIGKALSVLMSLALSLGGARPENSLQATGDAPVADSAATSTAFVPRMARVFLPDPAYGQNGVTALSIGTAYDPRPYSIIGRQDSGKLVLSVRSTTTSQPEALRRMNADGTFDEQFGSGGWVALPKRRVWSYQSERLGPDGRIYRLTFRQDEYVGLKVFLDRYLPDGQYETTFELTSDFKPAGSVNNDIPSMSLYLMPDGGWLIVASSDASSLPDACGLRYEPRFVLLRYSASGQRDSGYYGRSPVCGFQVSSAHVTPSGAVFLREHYGGRIWRIGPDGKRDFSYEIDLARAIGPLQDGSPIAVADTGEVFAVKGDGTATYGFRIDGTLAYSRSFALGAIVTPPLTVPNTVSMYRLPDGRTLMFTKAWVVRALPNGNPDRTYGQGGVARLHNSNDNYTLLPTEYWVDNLGRLSMTFGLSVIRLTESGIPDTAFGGAGEVWIKVEQPAPGTPTGILQQSSGHMVVAGTTWIGHDRYGQPVLGMARIDTNGALDTSFGDGGTRIVTSMVGGALVSRLDGAFAIANATYGAYTLRGFLSNGKDDTSFGENGIYTVTLPATLPGSVTIARILRGPDGGSFLIGTARGSSGHDTAVWVTRHTADGILDRAFADDGFWHGPLPGYDDAYASATISAAAFADGRVVLRYGGWADNGRMTWLSKDGVEQRSSITAYYLRYLDLLVLPDDEILTLDYYGSCGKCEEIHTVQLKRLHADGTLDQTFAKGGYVFRDLSFTRLLAADANGQVCLIGYATVCFDAVGVPDRQFGANGTNLYALPSSLTTHVLITSTDTGSRTIYAAGYAAGQGMHLVRLIETSIPVYDTYLPVTPNYATVCREYC